MPFEGTIGRCKSCKDFSRISSYTLPCSSCCSADYLVGLSPYSMCVCGSTLSQRMASALDELSLY